MMQPEPLQFHPIKDGLGGRRFQDAGQGRTRFREKLFAYKRVCIVHITGSPPVENNVFGFGETFDRWQAIRLLVLIN